MVATATMGAAMVVATVVGRGGIVVKRGKIARAVNLAKRVKYAIPPLVLRRLLSATTRRARMPVAVATSKTVRRVNLARHVSRVRRASSGRHALSKGNRRRQRRAPCRQRRLLMP